MIDPMKVINRTQIALAKAVLNIPSSEKLAELMGVGAVTLRRIESPNPDRNVRIETLIKVRLLIDELLTQAGWELLENGGIQPKPTRDSE